MTASIDDVSDQKFDFVVIGGGTAGLTLAVRLSEDPNISVLVLEAGPENLNDQAILAPGAFGSHFGKPEYDWAFNTVPQVECDGRSVYWARGKGLGGSSAINFFQYHLPPKCDIDAIEQLGNVGWNWNLLKDYYKKTERFVPPATKTDTMSYDLSEHGSDGPLVVGYPVTLSGFEEPFQKTLESVGVKQVAEPFSGDTNGTWISPVSIHPESHIRSYAANTYYEPNTLRKNLTVLTAAQVTKIIVERPSSGAQDVTATGVVFTHSGKTHQAYVAKEVVLSAGAIMSPQILELSGIGDNHVLEKFGIPVKVDLPGVGNNVQEHVYSGASYEVRADKQDDYLTFDCLNEPEELSVQMELLKSGKGVLGMSLACVTFVPITTISPEAPALYKSLAGSIEAGIASGKYSPALQKQFKIQLEHIRDKQPTCELILMQTFATQPNPPEPKKKYITMSCLLNHPFSRGTIHIKSSEPLEHPAIDPHYFEEKYDILSFVEMLKFNRRLVQREPLKSILTGKEVNPGPEIKSDEQIAEWLKAQFSTTFHTIGSCSMLPLEDGGVVDTKLKVYKTTNIRVVDISIIPLHISAHMQATAYALGELGADIIKGKARV